MLRNTAQDGDKPDSKAPTRAYKACLHCRKRSSREYVATKQMYDTDLIILQVRFALSDQKVFSPGDDARGKT